MTVVKIKKQCAQKIVSVKFWDYKNCLQQNQLENEINHQDKIKLT